MALARQVFALRHLSAAVAIAVAIGAGADSAAAETGVVRLAQQFGLHYLPLHVMVEKGLIQKHAKAAGLGEVTVELVKLGGGAAVNDALLSGGVDFAAGGTGPLLTIWDKSRGNVDIRGIGSIVSLPMVLNTNNPNLKSLRDLTDKDRIAVPAVKVSIQAVVLQMAAKKLFGDPNRFDPMTVSMRHPDAVTALLSGEGHITAHFAVPPFSHQVADNPKIHAITTSYDILGGEHMQIALYNTRKYRDDNPRLFRATYAALAEAMDIINADKKAAAELYVRFEKSKLDVKFVESMVRDPKIVFTTTPKNVMQFAKFMHGIGSLKKLPASWKELFWETVHDRPGS